MNDYEKEKLREHWQKPGTLKALLAILPMVPYSESSNYKKIVWMTGITFQPTDMAQVYYMLEEMGIIVREDEQPEPAEYLVCTHSGAQNPCHHCQYEIHQRGARAALRYRLAKPLSEY